MNACMRGGRGTAFKHSSLIFLKSRMRKHPCRMASSVRTCAWCLQNPMAIGARLHNKPSPDISTQLKFPFISESLSE